MYDAHVRIQRKMSPLSPLYEIHTAVYLNRLSAHYDQKITLGNIPQSELNRLLGLGVKSVWLMGVWSRSSAARRIALNDADFQSQLKKSIAGFSIIFLDDKAVGLLIYDMDCST